MQTIYTLITSSYNGTITMNTSVISFFDRTLADETKAAIESANKNAYFPIRCRIEETTLYESRNEVDLLKPEVLERLRSNIETNTNQWRERKQHRPTIISLETQQKFADALGITLEQYREIKDVNPNTINEEI